MVARRLLEVVERHELGPVAGGDALERRSGACVRVREGDHAGVLRPEAVRVNLDAPP